MLAALLNLKGFLSTKLATQSAHPKAVVDDSLIIVDTISLNQHKLDYWTIDHLYEDLIVKNTRASGVLKTKISKAPKTPKDPKT